MSAASGQGVALLRATTPAEVESVKALFLDYLAFVEDFLGASLDFQGTEAEFRDFPAVYDTLFLATLDGEPVGAVGVKPFSPREAELKRLWVAPAARGHRVGHRLVQAAIASAREDGYARMLLDTNAGLHHANRIYEMLGFEDIPPYYTNPLGNTSRYMALTL